MANTTKKATVVKKTDKKKSDDVAKKTAPLKSNKPKNDTAKKTVKTLKTELKAKIAPKQPNKSKNSKSSKEIKPPVTSKATQGIKTPPQAEKLSTSKDKVTPVIPKPEPKVVTITQPENKKLVNKTTIKPIAPPVTPTNGKTRYSDVELAEFKAIIDEKLLTSRQELTYLQEQIVEMNENNADIQGSDWFDDSSIHAEVELLNNMAIRQRQFIQNLENALVRIENKTYGICAITGTLIDKKRLMLVPHATKSIEAKHIEQATMIPEINQVAPDERVLRRAAEGKSSKKSGSKKPKSKSSGVLEEEDGDDIEAPVEDMDIAFEGGDD